MGDLTHLRADLMADLRRGFRHPGFEDLLVAALVALPFTGTLGILLLSAGLPGWLGVVIAGLAQGVATFWITGYRAREDA